MTRTDGARRAADLRPVGGRGGGIESAAPLITTPDGTFGS